MVSPYSRRGRGCGPPAPLSLSRRPRRAAMTSLPAVTRSARAGRGRRRSGSWGGSRGRHGGMLRPPVRQPLRLRGDAEGGRGAPGRAQRPRAAAAAALPGAHGPLRPRRPEPELGAGQEAHPAAPLRRGGRQLHRGLAVRGLPRPGAGRQQRAAAAVGRRRAFSVVKAAAGLFGLFRLLLPSERRAEPAVPVRVPW